jgi:hypothetical protein
MKRFAIVTGLAILLALAVAGPAVAFATTPPDGAYVWPYDGGSWGTVVDGLQTDVWNPPGTPIPAGTDVYIGSGWITYTRGLSKILPSTLLYKVAPTGDASHPLVTYTQGKTYWSISYIDPTVPELYPAFNEKLGAKAYVRDWWCPLSGETGDYDLTLFEKFRHTTTDLCGGYFEGQFHPVMYRAGVTEYPFVYTVE